MAELSTLRKEARFILKQKMFFVATAPLSEQHHVNVSPKSAEELRIVDDNTIAYVDLTGSGSETTAHLLQNGRITVMFCAFDRSPKILRVQGKGKVVLLKHLLEDPVRFASIRKAFDLTDEDSWKRFPAARSVIVVEASRVATSCGWAVPVYDYVRSRNTLNEKLTKSVKADAAAVELYQEEVNALSIDGLPSYGKFKEENPLQGKPTKNILVRTILKAYFRFLRLSATTGMESYRYLAVFLLGCAFSAALRKITSR